MKERRRSIMTPEYHIEQGGPEPDNEGEDLKDLRHYVALADGLAVAARTSADVALAELASCVELAAQARAQLQTALRAREGHPLGARPKRMPRKRETSPPTRLRSRRGKERR